MWSLPLDIEIRIFQGKPEPQMQMEESLEHS